MNTLARSDLSAKPALVAVGDVHGCRDLLLRLLEKIDHKMGAKPYRMIFLGDYVDRGPDSCGVLDTLIDYQLSHPDAVFLKGNHEQAMLDFLADPEEGEAWLSWGGEETLASYGIPVEVPLDMRGLQNALANAMPDRHFNFLMNLDIRHDEDDYVFVHAGLNPDRSLEGQSENDMLWIRDVFFAHGKDCFPEVTVVHGHTPVKKAEDHSWRINVDTGAVWSSRLSAVVLNGNKRSFITT